MVTMRPSRGGDKLGFLCVKHVTQRDYIYLLRPSRIEGNKVRHYQPSCCCLDSAFHGVMVDHNGGLVPQLLLAATPAHSFPFQDP